MKKYNWIITASVFLYIIIACISFAMVMKQDVRSAHPQRIEINRIMHEIEAKSDWEKPDLSSYSHIEDVYYLDVKENDETAVSAFYKEDDTSIQIQPWFDGGTLKGYVKFMYHVQSDHKKTNILIVEGGLFILEIFILFILYYLKHRLIQPLKQINDIPTQLALGHYKGEIKKEKDPYLGHFLWGLGQLKDNLDISKKRQLELEKEKKQMLLSLSHDIKTPLNLIKLYARSLEDHVYEDEASKMNAIKQITCKSSEIETYVNEIMKTSREDILDIQVDMGEFYLQDLMQRLLSIYQETCALRMMELRVKPYENRLLKGDIDRMLEVLDNLFENAFKYGDGRYIELSFYEEDYHQLICVHNSGALVQENEFNHLFDSFFRGVNSKGKQGSGLGLYICKEIMRKMNGDIFAVMKEDGMAFTIVIS